MTKENIYRLQDQSIQMNQLDALRNHRRSRWLIPFLMIHYREDIVRDKKSPQSTRYLSA